MSEIRYPRINDSLYLQAAGSRRNNRITTRRGRARNNEMRRLHQPMRRVGARGTNLFVRAKATRSVPFPTTAFAVRVTTMGGLSAVGFLAGRDAGLQPTSPIQYHRLP